MTMTLQSWVKFDWKQADPILIAKKNLIMGLYYLNILKFNSGFPNTHTSSNRVKKQTEKMIIQNLNKSISEFQLHSLSKLCLRASLTIIEISVCQVINPRKKSTKIQQSQTNENFYKQLLDIQKKVLQCQKMCTDRQNNLIGFMEFQNQIKDLKNILKDKLWSQSDDTLVCMRSVPLIINQHIPIIQNLVRKKNKFRKQIENVVNQKIDLCAKFQILTKDKLKEEVQNGCTMLVLTANVKIFKKKPHLVFQGIRMEEDMVEINSRFTEDYDLSKIKILMIAGNNAYQAIKSIEMLLEDPPVMISLGNTTPSLNLEQLKRQAKEQKKVQDLKIFAIEEKRKNQISFLKEFIRLIMSRQVTSKKQIQEICKECSYLVKNSLELQVLYEKRKSPIQILHKQGTYKDLSPGYQKNHNVDMKTKFSDNSNNFICIRRWMDTYQIFEHIRKRNEDYKNSINQKDSSPAVYINIFGDINSGKSSFVQQIARLFVERERYSAGVYIIDGKILQKKYQGEFQNYLTKQSETGKIITLEEFQKNGDSSLMLIIDDFHFIKPKSNGRFNLFLQKIVDKKVNLIIVTNTIYQQQIPPEKENKKIKPENQSTQFMFNKIKSMKINKLSPFELDIIAAYLLDFSNPKMISKYEQLKANNLNEIKIQDIYDLKNNQFSKKKHQDFRSADPKQMKKMQSLNQR